MSITNYTFTGYGAQVKIEGTQTICTGGSISFGQKLINSSGSFMGGMFDSDKTQVWINSPLRMDTPQITLSLSFQMTAQLMATFCQMIENKRKSYQIEINNVGKSITFVGYWNKISLQVQQNALMTGSVDFNIWAKYSDIYQTMVFFGKDASQTNKTNFGLFGTNFGCSVIPYYATSITLNGKSITYDGFKFGTTVSSVGKSCSGGSNFIPIAWSVDFSQQINFKTMCGRAITGEGLSSTTVTPIAPLPTHVAFGMLNCNINITTLIDCKDGLKLNNLSPYIDIKNFKLESDDYLLIKYLNKSTSQEFAKLKYLQLQSATPQVLQASNFLSCELSYLAHKISKLNKDGD